MERRRPAKGLLGGTAVLSLSWLGFYVYAVLGPHHVLHAHVAHHSIDYGMADLRGAGTIPLLVWQLAYLAFICGPLLLVRTVVDDARWRWYGAVVVVFFIVSDVMYWYAFASVWCFFAALSSLLLAYAFAKLPGQSHATAVCQAGGQLPRLR